MWRPPSGQQQVGNRCSAHHSSKHDESMFAGTARHVKPTSRCDSEGPTGIASATAKLADVADGPTTVDPYEDPSTHFAHRCACCCRRRNPLSPATTGQTAELRPVAGSTRKADGDFFLLAGCSEIRAESHAYAR